MWNVWTLNWLTEPYATPVSVVNDDMFPLLVNNIAIFPDAIPDGRYCPVVRVSHPEMLQCI